MANLNKVMLIGRLTRDPEAILVDKGAKFGFAVNNRKLNQQTQQWEDEPVFIDCEVWNRGENKQADRVVQTLRKGQQVFIEGHLKMDQWEDKNGGGKRTALRVVVESFQYLEPRADGGQGEAASRAAAPARQAATKNGTHAGYADEEMSSPPARGDGEDDSEIPF